MYAKLCLAGSVFPLTSLWVTLAGVETCSSEAPGCRHTADIINKKPSL